MRQNTHEYRKVKNPNNFDTIIVLLEILYLDIYRNEYTYYIHLNLIIRFLYST